MSEPSFSTRLADWFYLRWNTGVRVRYWLDPDGVQQCRILGDIKDKRFSRFLRFIEELQPDGEGTVDAKQRQSHRSSRERIDQGCRLRAAAAEYASEFMTSDSRFPRGVSTVKLLQGGRYTADCVW